jgi:hypothetical protein
LDHRRAILALPNQETFMPRIKSTITAAIAALALTTASFAISSQAFAGGHGHGGHGHGHFGRGHFGHGHFGHGHFGHRFYAYNSCWKWTPYGPINVCYRSY